MYELPCEEKLSGLQNCYISNTYYVKGLVIQALIYWIYREC